MIICVRSNQYTCNSNGLNRVNEQFESGPFTKNFQQTSVATSSELDRLERVTPKTGCPCLLCSFVYF